MQRNRKWVCPFILLAGWTHLYATSVLLEVCSLSIVSYCSTSVPKSIREGKANQKKKPQIIPPSNFKVLLLFNLFIDYSLGCIFVLFCSVYLLQRLGECFWHSHQLPETEYTKVKVKS